MELGKIKDLIQKARSSAQTEELRQLIDHFESFITLYHEKGKEGDPEFQMKLDASNRAFWAAFEKVASHFGLTPQSFKEYFEDPKNFTPQQWGQIQTLQREIEENEPGHPVGPPRKLNNKMRI